MTINLLNARHTGLAAALGFVIAATAQAQTTPGQDGQRGARCDQENELARGECLRRDMTDDDDLPAGVTRSMHQRRQQAQSTDSNDVASSADTRSDGLGAPSPTRTTTAAAPPPRIDSDRQNETDEETPPANEADNQADTLGGER